MSGGPSKGASGGTGEGTKRGASKSASRGTDRGPSGGAERAPSGGGNRGKGGTGRAKAKKVHGAEGGGRETGQRRAGGAVLDAGGGATDGRAGELINMDEAIRRLRTSRPTFYRWLRSGKLKGMKVGRQWRFYREDIERFLAGQQPRVDLPADIGPLIDSLRRQVEEAGVGYLPSEEVSGVREAVGLMIVLGVGIGATGIHITTHVNRSNSNSVAVLRYRIDGVLYERAGIDPRLMPAIIEEWKRMASCDLHEKGRPQDGRVLVNLSELSRSGPDRSVDLLTSFLPTPLGESLTVRLLDQEAAPFELDRIDYAPRDKERLKRAIHMPWGVIVVTGPSGCGKTTTLYSCLNELARPELKTLTVEDPVECLLPWATQVAVNEAAGMTFERAARGMMRSDPDVILISEIRNLETLRIALQAALTGHLVFMALHTNDAASALTRMVDVGADPFVVAEATKLVVAQRLVRRLCSHCSVADGSENDRRDLALEAAREGGLDWDALPEDFRKAVGCEKCGRTGYRPGRNVIAEALEVTPEIARASRNGASAEELRNVAVGQGMSTMAADGIRRAANGETTLDEIMRVIG